MFKKLKEKITEEVKSSPQRFAEFTQSVSDKLQSNMTTDENFFSIGDDDTSTPMNSSDHGFSSVALVSPTQEGRHRRSSNSSLASDISFLPRYESGSMYHLQSDLDVSASEVEDNASTTSSQLGHLSKEQIYAAFQKSQMRYHKYRGRYTDLTRHYKDLERENAKMKSVLVETQDKAIRRVNELKEQCVLEQKAKAHLESALRDELDEKNIKIQTLQTKVELLQSGNNSTDLLVDLGETNSQTENLENLTKYLNDARKEIETLNEKIQEMKANSIIFQSKEQEYKTKIANFEKEIGSFAAREKENNLKLAQSKMELHNEILNKETEITNLKSDVDVLRQSLAAIEAESKSNINVKLENLQTQNKKLIDKVESLTGKCNNLESELLKVEKYKIEIQDLQQREDSLKTELSDLQRINEKVVSEKNNLHKFFNNLKQGLSSCEDNIKKLSEENLDLKETLTKERKDFENQILTIREEAKKGLLSLEPKIREKIENDHLKKVEQLRREFAGKVEELSNDNNVKEAQLQLFEKDDVINRITGELEMLRKELSKKVDEYYDLEKNHLELIDESSKLHNIISNLEKDKLTLENYEEKVSRLEAHIATLQEELKEMTDICAKKEEEIVYLSKENLNLQQSSVKTREKLRIYEEKYEAIHLDSSEGKLIELKLQKLEEEKKALLNELEVERKMFSELLENHNAVKEKQVVISEMQEILERTRHEVLHANENLEKEREKNVHLYDKKHSLELEVAKLKEQGRINEEKQEVRGLDKSECGILELKLKKLEEENENLIKSFELERRTFEHELESLRQDLATEELTNLEETMGIPTLEESSIERFREKLHFIRQISENKEKDNVFLAQENLALQQEKSELSKRLRLLEEKLEGIKLTGTECKLLELQVQRLEDENKGLSDEFEMERKMFSDLLKNREEVEVQKGEIADLKEYLDKLHKDLITLRENLDDEKEANIRLQKEKLNTEAQVRKLQEMLRIAEEREETISLESSECKLLEIKLQKLEMENKNLLDTFELERTVFNKTYEEHAKNEIKLTQLIDENLQVKDIIKKSKKRIEELNVMVKNKALEQLKVCEENAQNAKKVDELKKKLQTQEEELQKLGNSLKKTDALEKEKESAVKKLNNVSSDNDKLRRELEQKDKQVSELSKNIASLSDVIQKQTTEFNSLLERTKQLDSVLEKMQIDGAEAIKREKERQNELTSKIEELQKELDEKTTKFAKLSQELAELEKLYAEEKSNYKTKIQEIESLQRKVAELQALEDSYKMIGQEKQVVDNELVRLKVVESNFKAIEDEKNALDNKLKQVESEFKAKNNDVLKKFKVAEQECNMLREEKENLLGEIKNLRSKVEDLSSEANNLRVVSSKMAESDYNIGQLKNENSILQNKCDSLNEEITELNQRINQISSDNRIIVDENQALIHANEELKIKVEFLENEKSEFDEIKRKLVDENASLSSSVDEIKNELGDIQKQHLQLVNDRNLSSSNEVDINKIQRDFYEIKEKCDSLFVENKNLKAEYKKLEDKCNDFGKIKKKLETQISEIENQYTEILHEKQLLQDEVQELKISPLNVRSKPKLDQLEILKREKTFTTEASTSSGASSQNDKDEYAKEIEILQGILSQYKSLDLTNKSSIEFYESELQKMKNQNEKLNRKLDETLVTLNHCAELSSSTEVEYLKNVLYNYMLGKESLVLARVIAAVCKFDPQQTETVLQREQQKQTLLGHLGLI